MNSETRFSPVGRGQRDCTSTDYVDLGLPFFLGRSVFVGFAGTTAYDSQDQLVTYPNGYWAF